VLGYLLPLIPPSLLSTKNAAGSTPLHWATLNAHLAVTQQLVQFNPADAAECKDAPHGAALIDIKNNAGHTPLGEAENAGWEEGSRWLVAVMSLDSKQTADNDAEADVGTSVQDVEIEIQDVEGQVARMSVKKDDQSHTKPSDSAV
jgi:uncharacterized protein